MYGIYKGDTLIDRYTTDKDGKFTTSYYTCDTDWTLREITAPVGYTLDKTVEEYDKYQIECVMEVTRINENLAGELEIGEGSNVYNPANNKLIGTVVAEPEFKNTITTAFDEESVQEIYPEVEGLKDIYITVRVEAEKTEWGYAAGDLYFVVNSSARFRVGDFECNATCLDLKVVD